MPWELKFEKRAKKDLKKIPEKFRERIISILPLIAADPYVGKKLSGNFEGVYSYRVWPYRLLYKIEQNVLVVIIIRIGHRQGFYK
jgi:mRNA interferase RelE/StbE